MAMETAFGFICSLTDICFGFNAVEFKGKGKKAFSLRGEGVALISLLITLPLLMCERRFIFTHTHTGVTDEGSPKAHF